MATREIKVFVATRANTTTIDLQTTPPSCSSADFQKDAVEQSLLALALEESQISASCFDASKNEILLLDFPGVDDTPPPLQQIPYYLDVVKKASPNVDWENQSVQGDENEFNPSTIDLGNDVNSTAPTWKNDTNCSKCGIEFSWGYGLFKAVNRHHCRNCGASVCDTHSEHRTFLPHLGLTGLQRVCDDCFKTLPPIPEQHSASRDSEYAQLAISETESNQEHIKHLTEIMQRYKYLLQTVQENLSIKSGKIQHEMSVLSTRLPSVRKSFDDACRCSEIDTPSKSDPEQSVINFNYYSPQLQALGRQLPGFDKDISNVEQGSEQCKSVYDETMSKLKEIEAQVDAAMRFNLRQDSENWSKAMGEKMEIQKNACKQLEDIKSDSSYMNPPEDTSALTTTATTPTNTDATPPQHSASTTTPTATTTPSTASSTSTPETANTTDDSARSAIVQARASALDQISKAQLEARHILLRVVQQCDKMRSKLLQCGQNNAAFASVISEHGEFMSQRENTIAALATKINQWHMQRNAVVKAGQRKNHRITGNIHNKLNQRINALTQDKLMLSREIEVLKSELVSVKSASVNTGTQAVPPASLCPPTDVHSNKLLQQRIIALEKELSQMHALTTSKPATVSTTAEYIHLQKQNDELKMENQVLAENLKSEQRLNSLRIRDMQKLITTSQSNAAELVEDKKKVADERDSLRSHLTQLIKDQQRAHLEAEAVRTKGIDSEAALVRCHEALVSIFKTVHPTGGSGIDQSQFEIKTDSQLPGITLRLVEDHVAASTMISNRCDHLESQLETQTSNVTHTDASKHTDTSNGANITPQPTTTEQQTATTSTTTASSTTSTTTPPPSEKYATEINALRAMGLDLPTEQIIQALDEGQGDVNDAAMILLA